MYWGVSGFCPFVYANSDALPYNILTTTSIHFRIDYACSHSHLTFALFTQQMKMPLYLTDESIDEILKIMQPQEFSKKKNQQCIPLVCQHRVHWGPVQKRVCVQSVVGTAVGKHCTNWVNCALRCIKKEPVHLYRHLLGLLARMVKSRRIRWHG
jgi:hypothetical protein